MWIYHGANVGLRRLGMALRGIVDVVEEVIRTRYVPPPPTYQEIP